MCKIPRDCNALCVEGGDALNAFAAAAARAFAMGDGTATAWAKAMAAAVAQYGCDAVKPALAGVHTPFACTSQLPMCNLSEHCHLREGIYSSCSAPDLTRPFWNVVQAGLRCYSASLQ